MTTKETHVLGLSSYDSFSLQDVFETYGVQVGCYKVEAFEGVL